MMSRKSNDAPLKLIQLVPTHGKEETPSRSSSDEYDQGLRLQIGIEGEPSWGTKISDFLSRAITRHSHRYTNIQETEKERNLVVQNVGFVSRGRSRAFEVLQFVYRHTGRLLSGFKRALVSAWSRFHKTDDDLDGLVHVRLNRKAPQRSYDSIPFQDGAREDDQQDDGFVKELHALREEFNAQQYELSRVNNFVVDLKSRVVAQQKMILSLAEELDAVAMELPSSAKGASKESGAIQRH